jgi:hypothetical protein
MSTYRFSVDIEMDREGNPLHPYDPFCRRSAAEMEELDYFIFESEEDLEANGPGTAEQREKYVLEQEGTLNPQNGHFTCDRCYMNLGGPGPVNGRRWRCP